MADRNSERERRRFVRIELSTPASVTGPDGTDAVEVVDICLKGALLRVPPGSAFQREAAYRLRIDLSDHDADDSEVLVMDLELAYQRGELVGFRCHQIDVDSLTRLRELVEARCGDPELIHRELLQLFDDA